MLDEFSRSTGPTSDDGTTCGHSRQSLSTNGESTASRAGSHAKTSASPITTEPDSTESEAGCSSTSCESFAFYDRASLSWKTYQTCLFGGWVEFSESWPRAGTMRNGKCSERISLDHRSIANASGYWHTPTTRDAKGQSGRGNRIKRGRNGKLHVANLCDQLVDIGRQDLVRSTTFREWLMGLPIGWTDLGASATPSFPSSPNLSADAS